MKKYLYRTYLAGMFAGIAMLAGCTTTPSTPDESVAQVQPQETAEQLAAAAALAAAQTALTEGVGLYNKGDYNGAIKRLNAAEIALGDAPTQVNALKYIAFSYCLTSRQTLCKQQFEKALKLDPTFDLAPGEKGH